MAQAVPLGCALQPGQCMGLDMVCKSSRVQLAASHLSSVPASSRGRRDFPPSLDAAVLMLTHRFPAEQLAPCCSATAPALPPSEPSITALTGVRRCA